MVKKRHLPIVLIGIFIFLTFIPIAIAQTEIQYHLEQEWVEIWINQDGTIDLLYNISVRCDLGTIHHVFVGQPNENFTIENAQDEAGHRSMLSILIKKECKLIYIRPYQAVKLHNLAL